jgi:hypothetical protein
MKRLCIGLVALLVLVVFITSIGCSSPQATPTTDETATPTSSEPTPAPGTEVISRNIYMMGRSVLEGWFKHWQWEYDDNAPVSHGEFQLFHRYVEGPDNGAQVMVNSVKQNLKDISANQKPVIFFKLCFIDFYGSSQEEADLNLQRNEGIVDSVYDIVVNQYGYTLILGNALPRTAQETEQYLISNHQEYNQYLESLQSQHPGVVLVFDMYSILADPNTGGIKSKYATGSDDAHLNDKGYDALDTAFFDFLEANF